MTCLRKGTVLGLAVAVAGCNGGGGGEPEGETGETMGDGDGDGDPTSGHNDIPLELVFSGFNATGQFLLLRFSEPMAPIDGVDPSDFRISFARTQNYSGYYGNYSWSLYVDPNVYYGAYGYYNPSQTLEVDLIADGNMPTDIVLRFATPLDPNVCAWLAQVQADYEANPNLQGKVGLFPHYSPGAVPIKSVDGEVLAPIGSGWVEYDSSLMSIEDYGWPNLDPQISIPCNL